MAEFPEGAPCWVDAMFSDLEGAKSFYADVLGWTFAESSSEYGNYTQAYSDGKAVAAVVPPMPGQEGQSQWCLYLSSPDAAATAEKIKAAGGELLMEPMQVGSFGTMAIAKEPSGAVFGVWQPGDHKGFEKLGEPGSYCWAEFFSRDVAKADAFLPRVFPYGTQQMDLGDSPEAAGMDFKVFSLGGPENPVLGRMNMGSDFPPEIPSYVQVYFGVPDCDEAVAKTTKRGGKLLFGPMDSPFGRFAAVSDPQGAAFAVIDMSKTVGEMPKFA
ncbi:VOC family protein [Streptomyces sp. SID13666]|uniref:VOC family protein n=1 Tax=Streptomyces TaxID=1883 RepID=UPI001106F72C|nr:MULTISPECIES: VOC family protein [Streptomyces]MCZ4101649.1 VOC family protein [Streptomyces sp. H39-C1]NEA54232.1 VOC family protein [Streptomyces sp. SID13666]NEA70327.1 VOC family protein [Streptomyces sp. SID13588]QNA76417.1 VOC family protein [Streptomyces sp. So13.3]